MALVKCGTTGSYFRCKNWDELDNALSCVQEPVITDIVSDEHGLKSITVVDNIIFKMSKPSERPRLGATCVKCNWQGWSNEWIINDDKTFSCPECGKKYIRLFATVELR